jgi:MFS family permease
MNRLRHAFPITGDRLSGRLVTPANKRWWTLAAVSSGLFMIMLDATVVNVALPAIRDSLHMGLADLEWVVAGYALTFAAFMLTGGKLADLFGRRLVFTTGLTVFTGASLACGLAPNGAVLIGGRAVQGLGAALLNPRRCRSSPPPSRRASAAQRSASGRASPRLRSRSGRWPAGCSPSTRPGTGSSSSTSRPASPRSCWRRC